MIAYMLATVERFSAGNNCLQQQRFSPDMQIPALGHSFLQMYLIDQQIPFLRSQWALVFLNEWANICLLFQSLLVFRFLQMGH